MAKKKKELNLQDDISSVITDSLKSTFKNSDVSFYIDDLDQSASAFNGWVSTGCTTLDLIISNRKNAGLPLGRIVEFTGNEGAGKSLLVAHILANTQKLGGLAVYIDTENAFSYEFAKAIGMDITKLLYIQMTKVEDIFDVTESIIKKIREADKDRIVAIAIDSVSAASTAKELESEHGQDGYATGKAIAISKAMRKITNVIGNEKILLLLTNQLRVKLGCINPNKTSVIYRKEI